ncbi:unnamed protein product [Schistosoma turkestanicum]|nr:unnamed protein product [Schistosoma turkestanicum]
MTNYRTELRIPIDTSKKSMFNNNDNSFLSSNDNHWNSRSRHTSANSEQLISHNEIPWHRRFRTISADPSKSLETTNYISYDDMKRRMEERRKQWDEEFKFFHHDDDDEPLIMSSNRLKSSNDNLFHRSREQQINSSISSLNDHSPMLTTPSTGYEQFPDGSVHFVANFNLTGYDPELLKVFVRDGKLMIIAKTEHNQSAQHGLHTTTNTTNNNKTSSKREYTHSINLPPNADDTKISAVLSLNGILTVSCPMKPPIFSLSSTSLQSPHSDNLLSYWNKQPSPTRRTSQPYSHKFNNVKSPKFNQHYSSTHSSLSDCCDMTTLQQDQHDYCGERHSSLNQLQHQQPLRQTKSSRFHLELPIDHEYSPGEIQIKTLNHRIYIRARHEERAPNRTAVREFSKEYDIPENIEPENLTAKFINGMLYIEESPTI